MPTLYDNFERVRQYIDQHQGGGGDLSAYVTKDELSAQSYLTTLGGEVTGKLNVSYYTTNTQDYGLKSYSHVIAGDQDRTTVTFIATQRKCGGAEGTSYMASFFTNSDGRSKFAHKSYTNKANIGGESDDAFMCFNAYGFKIAYSGEQGVAASTEYEILHTGNIGNLSYVTQTQLDTASYASSSDIPDITKDIIPSSTNTWVLGNTDRMYSSVSTRSVWFGSGVQVLSQTSTSSPDIGVNLNGSAYYYLNRTRLQPASSRNGQIDLGASNAKWNAAYVNKIYLNGTDIDTRLSSYVTKADLSSQSYATQTYVADYVSEHGGGTSPDLSNYVTYTYLYSYVGSVVGDIESLLANI